MGDFRASIKIEIELYDVADSIDMYINYNGTSGEVYGVDNRIIEFFQNIHDRAYARYRNDLAEFEMRSQKDRIEQQEREELERLKAKYEGGAE